MTNKDVPRCTPKTEIGKKKKKSEKLYVPLLQPSRAKVKEIEYIYIYIFLFYYSYTYIYIHIYARLDKSSLSNFEANILFLLQTEMLMKLLVVRARWAVHAHLLRCVRARAERDEQPRCQKRATEAG